MDSPVKKKSLSWDDLHTLAVLAQAGSFGAAAKAMRLSRGTVVRRIERLEKSIGVEVVTEHLGEVRLTDEGKKIAGTASEMRDLAASVASTRQQEPRRTDVNGKVRLTAPEGIAGHLVAPCCAELNRRHPGLQLVLVADSTVLSISHKEVDVAVRLVYPTDSNLVALPAGNVRYFLYASRASVAAAGEPEKLRAVAPIVGYDDSGELFPESAWLRANIPDRPRTFRSNSLFSQIQALRTGTGMGLLPQYVESRYPELVRLSDQPCMEKNAFVVFHGKDRDQDKIRTVVDCLQAQLRLELGC